MFILRRYLESICKSYHNLINPKFQIKPSKPLPVMVWIHGGAFKMGSANEDIYGPDYLLQKNMVFVSMNYRLGALGIEALLTKRYWFLFKYTFYA